MFMNALTPGVVVEYLGRDRVRLTMPDDYWYPLRVRLKYGKEPHTITLSRTRHGVKKNVWRLIDEGFMQ